ncbi:MAG: hypothetical protein ACLTZT_09490 [Butyricimonas faecalis]
MKTGIYLLIFIAWLAIGCSDFLNESSSDEIRPSTLTDLEQLLLGDGYEDAYNFITAQKYSRITSRVMSEINRYADGS